MFKRLAKFRLLEPRRTASGLREAMPAEVMPANDNLPGFRRPGGPRRIRSQVLVCHWSLVDGGTRLGCRWQAEALARTTLEDSGSERANDRFPATSDPAWTSPQPTKFSLTADA